MKQIALSVCIILITLGLLAFGIVSLVGCGGKSNNSPTVTPTVIPTATPIKTQTATPIVTPIVTPESTPGATATDTPTVTPTVAPTVAPTVVPTTLPGDTTTITGTINAYTAAYNAENFELCVAYIAGLDDLEDQNSMIVCLQQKRAITGAITKTSVTNIVITGSTATATVTSTMTNADSGGDTYTEICKFQNVGGTWKYVLG